MSWSSVDGRRPPGPLRGGRERPAALFLHGWGLRPNAYRGPSRPWPAAGCRVYAPCPARVRRHPRAGPRAAHLRRLRPLGRARSSMRWASGEVALVAGHSFGGGVATAFVYHQPGRASALLLANAIGSPTWALFPNEVRTMVQRPFWDWGRHFGTDLLHSPDLVRLLPTLLEDFIPNLVRQPAGHVPHRRVHPPGRPGRRGAGHRRPGHPGHRGLVRPRRPGAPVGLRRAAACRRGRRGGGRRVPRLADRRSRPSSGSWPSAPWSTPAPSRPDRRPVLPRPSPAAGGT